MAPNAPTICVGSAEGTLRPGASPCEATPVRPLLAGPCALCTPGHTQGLDSPTAGRPHPFKPSWHRRVSARRGPRNETFGRGR